ncbi:DUF4265 domain-containing protein [Nakamurella endophytica]|uniref:DUF4265 domain-containing protein n=1 Tax=Nakamurella endophytica TaxID=1748367 RepID=A0A917WIZ5_9ACTN|nr:DUF4265 domain-containing protein [Nakamurella endophytica]GGM06983.1 hypothetical protein GCM10011594_28770 [Nakamurella endophytica]
MSTHDPEVASTAVRQCGAQVTVLFQLRPDDDWPPFLAEPLTGRLVTPFLVEITAAPRYAQGVSRGDVVAVSMDGANFVGRHVRTPGGHATVHVVAATDAELAPVREVLVDLGATVETAGDVSMLVVDIPPHVELPAVERVLAAAVSMTCDYEISHARPARDRQAGSR